ncbi:MAG TPA: 1-(5-phosphoribosyl)-5-[(5-phosphoribosylamino)methylideneamino] imidazole-4-carboxamide isomerase [Holophagaceae bacterium]|nr:1-(5-phosphoribosyl)-5-[(5-phosphoribosylamino)methylideneamino] imidazole-4-carboxamide isomerase [Holophagaceae bacterium]
MVQLIPSMDLLGGRVVRLLHGDFEKVTAYELDPLAWVEKLVDAGATRIHLVDLDGAFGLACQPHFIGYPRIFTEVRFQLGGGLRSREAVERVLDAGFDPVVGTLAVEHPRELAGLPAHHVICALDLRGDRVVTKGWTAESVCETTDVFESLLTLGFNRALVTDVSRDGSLEGPGLEATRWIAKEGFQVQASGGLRDLRDLKPLAEIPGVVGAISGKALLEGRIDLHAPATRAALAGSAQPAAGGR